MRGHFVQQGSIWFVIFMIIEKSDLDQLSPLPAAPVRLLDLGQIVGLDSEEGHSLNLTCAEDTTALVVDHGERSQLFSQEGLPVSNTIADRVQDQRRRAESDSERASPRVAEALRKIRTPTGGALVKRRSRKALRGSRAP